MNASVRCLVGGLCTAVLLDRHGHGAHLGATRTVNSPEWTRLSFFLPSAVSVFTSVSAYVYLQTESAIFEVDILESSVYI